MISPKPKKRTVKQIILDIDPIVIDSLDDPRIVKCKYCGEHMLLAQGAFGYSCYTIRKYGTKWKSTLTKKHYGSGNKACMRKWLEDPKHRDDLARKQVKPITKEKTDGKHGQTKGKTKETKGKERGTSPSVENTRKRKGSN